MDQNKIRTYILYALGEILLVVIGILIALQVNNWNEERKLDTERQALLASMHSDFITTRARLDQSLIQVDDIIGRMENLLSVAYKVNYATSADSLLYWAGAAYELAQFQPILSSYNEALSSGKIGLINDKQLMELIAEFQLAYNFYQSQVAISGEIFYTGSIWEIRKELGTLQVIGKAEADASRGRLTYPEAFPLSDKELREYLAQPNTFAAFENFLTIHYNIKEPFVEMDVKASLIIKQLDQMLQDYK